MTTIRSIDFSLTADTKRLQKDLRRARYEWRKNTRAIRSELRSLGKVATSVFLGLGAATVGASRTFGAVDREVNKVTALVGVSREQLSEWSEDIGRIGTTAGKGPQELLSALYDITSAGLTGSTAIDTCLLYTSPSPRDS